MFEIIEAKKIIDSILKELPERNRDIISRHFELGEKKLPQKETLQEIGDDYGITRERVRQIEEKGLDLFQKSSYFPKLRKYFSEIENYIDTNGGLKREDILVSQFSPQATIQPYFLFLLKLGEPFYYHNESNLFYSFWRTREETIELARKINEILAEWLEKEKRILEEEMFLEEAKEYLFKNFKIDLLREVLLSYIEAGKKIEKNPFDSYGLSDWPEIKPKGARDKAYLILKKEGKPLHFREITELIKEKLSFPVQINTLHNELIKNENFILIGKGIYALREWGYKKGTVKEIIEEILKEKGALTREEILEEIANQRLVKEDTIIFNLQHFKKTEGGKYEI